MNGPILRVPVLRIARARWFRYVATQTPVGRAVALRFVAGEHLDDAFRAVRELDRVGLDAILDHLGENVTAPEHAAQAVADYVRALDRIRAEPDLDVMVSVKLTQLGLDFSEELCAANLERGSSPRRSSCVTYARISRASVPRAIASSPHARRRLIDLPRPRSGSPR